LARGHPVPPGFLLVWQDQGMSNDDSPLPRRVSATPQDRLQRIADYLSDQVCRHPEFREGDLIITMIRNGEEGSSCLTGYNTTAEAVPHIFQHLQDILALDGKKVIIMPVSAN
jgi:hypothetical protein